MDSLEGLDTSFNYEHLKEYVRYCKDFIARAKTYCENRGLHPGTPFVDPTAYLNLELPTDLSERLNNWLGQTGVNNYVKTACHYYVRYLAAIEQGLELSADADLYSPLWKMIQKGGDFHLHHGDLCINQAATIPQVSKRFN